MPVSHVFLDIDDTLFPTSEFAALARKNALRSMIELGLPFNDSDELYTRLLAIIKKRGSNDPHHFDALLRELDIKNPARFIAAAVAAYHNAKASILPYPDVPRTLLQLRENGYQLYVATNGNAIKQWDKLIRLGVALYFEEVFVSDEIGIEKSKPFFKKVLTRLKVEPSSCIMIGDKEAFDTGPAKESGMHALLVRRDKNIKINPTRVSYVISDFSHLLEILKKL